MIPDDLNLAIEEIVSSTPLSVIAQATQELSKRYREPRNSMGSFVATDAHRLAYLTVRLPATYGVLHAVFSELKLRYPSFDPKSLLDIGAGPGTASWAASSLYSSIQTVTLLEESAPFIVLGKRLTAFAENKALSLAHWCQGSMTTQFKGSQHDLTIISYAIGEIESTQVPMVLKRFWEMTTEVMVIVEPGTPKGFERMLQVREELLSLGASLIAPCPHSGVCLKQNAADWCHFSCRVNRSVRHRQVKSAALGYEDEKYCYMIFTKNKGKAAKARVLHDPLKKSGHVHIELCTPNGIDKTVISKRNKEAYQWARRAAWGDGK